MSFQPEANKRSVVSFRTKLLAAMMLVVSALTALGLYLAQRSVAATAGRDLQQNFQAELSSLHKVQELRHAALAERCAALVTKPRIHAALEDNALDLLYPSGKDELRDLMEGEEPSPDEAARSLLARFYRFLDGTGAVLPPPHPKDVGQLSAEAEARLALKKLPATQQIGYVAESGSSAEDVVDEVMAVPIFSTETGDVISALVVGFQPFELAGARSGGMKSGIWLNGRLHLAALSKSAQGALDGEITDAVTISDRAQSNFTVSVNGAPHLLFYKRLNPDSLFPPAYEICIYPLAASMARLHRLRWQISAAGALLLLGGLVASNFIAARLSAPVEKLAVDSEKNRAQRKQAEAALASTSEELKRSTRYSADASHQLKSPVTVLRAGVETLLAREDFKPEVYEELSALLHQTHRLTGVIDDLLLLSRMDAGHLQLESKPVNLSHLIDEWLDDLGALPDSMEVKIEKRFPAELYVAGEKRYTSLIVQNLLENARKYNRPGGRIGVIAHKKNDEVVVTIGNTGGPIARAAQEHIFERFHGRSGGTAVSGHGLGLNLARELARLHGGDLRLVGSNNDWTEFEVRFRVVHPVASRAAEIA
ncbi:MAG: two-component system, OmpR family, sensor kinase [Verrucomicrobiota bacterium]